MNRPRRDDIDPMVPELSTTTYRPDGGGVRVDTDRSDERVVEADAPLVPDVS